jgi:hypothetical protein
MPPYNATQQAMLAQPLPPPASAGAGSNPYSVLAGTQSGTVGMPYKSGSTITDPGATGAPSIASGDLAASSGITGTASTSGGANVAGVVGQGEATDYSVDVPEGRDMQAEQANEFIDAYKEGYTTETGGDASFLWGEHGDGGKERGANTMSAARSAKRDDRRGDRDDRQKARKELQADLKAEYGETMGKGEARRKARRHSRKAKRTTRKGQKDSRKQAWQDFKGEKDLMKQDQAADLEKYM